MNREEMVKKLADLGYDVSKITDTTPDEVLAETLKAIQVAATAKADTTMADGEEDDKEKTEDMDEGEEPKTEAEKAAAYDAIMAALEEGDDDEDDGTQAFADAMNRAYADLDKPELSDEDKANLKNVLENVASMMEGDPDEDKEKEEMDKAEMTEAFSELAAKLEKQFDEKVASAAKELAAKADEAKATVTKFSEDQASSTKRSMIEKFCEAETKSGKIQPWELDESNPKVPSIKQRLYNADARNVVHKYSENGKEVAMTQLDFVLEAIRSRKPETFADKVPGASFKVSEDAEIAKIEANYDKFSETYQKHGTTKESMVKAFKARRQGKPDLTADEFIG